MTLTSSASEISSRNGDDDVGGEVRETCAYSQLVRSAIYVVAVAASKWIVRRRG